MKFYVSKVISRDFRRLVKISEEKGELRDSAYQLSTSYLPIPSTGKNTKDLKAWPSRSEGLKGTWRRVRKPLTLCQVAGVN